MKEIYKDIQNINKMDDVGPTDRLCKLFEESGELAQAVNRTIGRKKNKMSEEDVIDLICEEAADTIQCTLSLIDTYGITYDDLIKMMNKKNKKWKSRWETDDKNNS
jgi:NTP pyrophosphatase (non-canonical NTP hydrolase)